MAWSMRIEFPGAAEHVTLGEDEISIPGNREMYVSKNIVGIHNEGTRQGTNRDELICRSYVQHGYTMREIADYLKVHYVSVSRSIKSHESKKKK